MSALTLHHLPFDRLTTHQLYAMMVLRQEVFSVEQQCAYQDADGLDPKAHHVWLQDGERMVAYGRIFEPGIKYPESSIGRIVSAKSHRGTGAGRELVRQMLNLVDTEFRYGPCRISAQKYLTRFYESFGFVTVGSEYLEDNIPHIEMLRA